MGLEWGWGWEHGGGADVEHVGRGWGGSMWGGVGVGAGAGGGSTMVAAVVILGIPHTRTVGVLLEQVVHRQLTRLSFQCESGYARLQRNRVSRSKLPHFTLCVVNYKPKPFLVLPNPG